MKINNIGLIGLGAIGAPLATAFHNYDQDHFFIIAEGKRKERIEKGVLINNQLYHFTTLAPHSDKKLDLIIICTKYNQLEQTIQDISSFVDEHTRIIPFLNGISAEEKLASVFGQEKIIYGFTRIASMNENSHIQYKNQGCYYFGHPQNPMISEDIQEIHDVFTNAGIRHKIPEDMLASKWFKFMCNVGENQVSAVLDIPFGAWNASDHANYLREAAGNEVNLIAQAKGIHIKPEWIEKQRASLDKIPYHNNCSMVQDLHAKRPTEVDMFALEVIKMGQEYHIATPVNDILYHMIKVLEEKNNGEI